VALTVALTPTHRGLVKNLEAKTEVEAVLMPIPDQELVDEDRVEGEAPPDGLHGQYGPAAGGWTAIGG
jgi:hypothetical protein